VRLSEPVVEGLSAHRSDRGVALLPAIHDFDRAHIVALEGAGWLEPDEAALLLGTLEAAAREEGVTESRQRAGGGIHSGEYLLIGALGEPRGGQVSLARSSADLGAVALRTIERDRLLDLGDALVALRAAILATAPEHLRTVMPLLAQGQHAQPTTVAHYLASWASVLERDTDRVLVAFGRVNTSPAGAAIGTGSSFVTDRASTAALLGFDAAIANTLDAVTSHDHVLDVLSTLAILGNDLGRLVDDLMGWSSPEDAYVSFPDRFCGTSSILAQARNPYAPQYIKGVSAMAAGALVNGLMVDRAGTGEAVLDRHQLSEQMLGLFGQTIRNVRWLTELVPALIWHEERLLASTRAHWATAPELAGALVTRTGVSWRSAHQITGIVVRLAEERGLEPDAVTPALVDEAVSLYLERLDALGVDHPEDHPLTPAAGGLTQADLDRAFDPWEAIEARTGAGGPAPTEVTAQLAALEAVVAAHRDDLAGRRARGAAAREALEAAVAARRIT
jgi:argininosuccinate lyase